MQRIYLDVCALCRPYDDQTFTRIHLETTAIKLILKAVESKKYHLLYSPIHEMEISAISDEVERTDLMYLVSNIGEKIDKAGLHTRKRAEELCDLGFGIADAAHVAYSERAGACFISCDDKLINKCSKVKINIWSGNPVKFCDEEGIK